jgi:two-component system sensor histidine kinase HydH
MQNTVQTRRRWSIWGLFAGALMGLGDLLGFLALGLDMRLAGRSVIAEVTVAFTLTYAALGFVIGKLMEARTQAREDAQTIAAQLHALETSQRAALQNEKLAAIGRLAAGIAHEVRNPLGVIRASASMVREHFGPNAEAYRACEFIREEIDRLNGLITALLTFSRPAELRVQPVEIEQVIDRALQLTSDEYQRRGITAARESQRPLPIVMADPDLIAQVIFGLLVNAAEAIGEQGLVIVRTASERDAMWIEVVDTGPGVTLADAERIFEPFFTTKTSGTGLGLPMAARIVRAHGGLIEALSGQGAGEGGAGAHFRVRLPLSGPAACEEQAA